MKSNSFEHVLGASWAQFLHQQFGLNPVPACEPLAKVKHLYYTALQAILNQ